MTDNYNQKPWIKMPLSELTTPKPGRLCKAPAWWAVTDDGCALFYKTYGSPQCNTDRRIVERIRPDCKQVFIEAAFVPHNCSDYC
ncbi:MAG TPA: hypothetical protein VJ654_14330 [Noviherbaspirillum sp.]|nr:hypothetical protein [Noviherbaspirillum sp.]